MVNPPTPPTTNPPAAGTPALELKERWAEERRRIIAERYRVKRECEERGEDCFLAVDPPPINPPPYWRTDTGEAKVTPLSKDPEVDPSPAGTIRLPFGVLGRPGTHVANAGEETPEQIFQRASLKDRAMAVLGVKW
jgi:hypothetical protein